jgi:hypothetical protein
MKVKVSGLEKITKKLEAMAREAGHAMASGTRIAAEVILTDVKESGPGRGVPVDEGVLRSTGMAIGPDSKATSAIIFGGAAADYALKQHEMVNLRHKVGEARYLVRGAERFFAAGGDQKVLREAARKITEAGRSA